MISAVRPPYRCRADAPIDTVWVFVLTDAHKPSDCLRARLNSTNLPRKLSCALLLLAPAALWWDECDNFVLLYKISPQLRFICEKALEVPCDKQPYTSTAVAGAKPVTPPLESGPILEGHG